MGELPSRVRAKTAFLSTDYNPLRMRVGDVITVGHRDGLWSGFVWGADSAGHGAWVPEEYLEVLGGHEAVALRDYDSSELTVAADDELEVLGEAGGWYLCRAASGASGWVPVGVVEPLR